MIESALGFVITDVFCKNMKPPIMQITKSGMSKINSECQEKDCNSNPETVGPSVGPKVSIETHSPITEPCFSRGSMSS